MSKTVTKSLGKSVKASLIGGLAGGIVFGILMQMMGMISQIAGMMGSDSVVVGWGIHLMISLIFGAGFGIFAVNTNKVYAFGLIYGIILWIVGPLIILPLMMGMGTMLAAAFAPAQLMSLMTHLMFTLILSFVYKLTVKA